MTPALAASAASNTSAISFVAVAASAASFLAEAISRLSASPITLASINNSLAESSPEIISPSNSVGWLFRPGTKASRASSIEFMPVSEFPCTKL